MPAVVAAAVGAGAPSAVGATVPAGAWATRGWLTSLTTASGSEPSVEVGAPAQAVSDAADRDSASGQKMVDAKLDMIVLSF